MAKVLFKNAQMLDPQASCLVAAECLVVDGLVAAIGQGLNAEGAQIIDLQGLVLAPGFVDLHTHLREPGFEYKETVASGTRAAAAGGFTTIACMPNTNPVLDSVGIIEELQHTINSTAAVRVLPIGAISRGSLGREMVDVKSLLSVGVCALSDDGRGVMNSRMMRSALELSAELRFPVIAHEEDHDLAAGGSINEGEVSRQLGDKGIPGIAEYAMLARDIYLAELTGGHLHVAHVSCAESVRLIREARQRGVHVTAEVTPHHLVFTENIVPKWLGQAKVNPPLRTEADREALLAGLMDGTIDIIATDHAPHSAEEKERPLSEAAFGFTGLDTAFALLNTALVKQGVLTLPALLRKLTLEPANLLGLASGSLQVGSPADLVVIDPDIVWQITADSLQSKGKNTPLLGETLQGRVLLTMVGGKIVYDNREAKPHAS